MNFHSLLRVDGAKRLAEKYLVLERELTNMIDHVVNNRNFILDKKINRPKQSNPTLHIYVGSDYGFCSNFNSQVNDMLQKDQEEKKILIGKKTKDIKKNVILRCYREAYDENAKVVEDRIAKGIKNQEYKAIYIIYNHYSNASHIQLVKKKIYPIDVKMERSREYSQDFLIETDANDLLQNMIVLYVQYSIRMCMVNAYAAENVLRQNTTRESLKKIDEREEMDQKKENKEKRAKAFRKTIEGFSKLKER